MTIRELITEAARIIAAEQLCTQAAAAERALDSSPAELLDLVEGAAKPSATAKESKKATAATAASGSGETGPSS